MSQYRRYRRPAPRQSTGALTTKLALLAVVGTLLIGGLIAAQMAAGNDPALGPKAIARAKKLSAKSTAAGSSATSTGGDLGTDPYTEGGYSSGYGNSSGSSGYSSGSSGYSSGSGYSTQQSSPAPVTSGTS